MGGSVKYVSLILLFLTQAGFSDGNRSWTSYEHVYAITQSAALCQSPNKNCKANQYLVRGREAALLDSVSGWYKVKRNDNHTGWVKKNTVARDWVKIYKQERMLIHMRGQSQVKVYQSAFCPFNPVGDKDTLGDGGTPEGRYYFVKLEDKNLKAKYGARSLKISYPGPEDARKGLQKKWINRRQYNSIIKSIYKGNTPLQTTKLGGSIRVHGGGSSEHWTLGCAGLDDDDVSELYTHMKKGYKVDIYKSRTHFKALNDPLWLRAQLIQAEGDLLKVPCKYTGHATKLLSVDYPMGDIDKNQGVCTEVPLRILRKVGIDLQAVMHEEAMNVKKHYPHVKKANANIDHRRTRNLKYLFDKYALDLGVDVPKHNPGKWQPGDIVLMDTGVNNGTIYDHIGMVSSQVIQVDGEIRPLVLNLWTVGESLENMDLLDGEYPIIVGHYRIMHPYDWNADVDVLNDILSE